MPLSAALTDPCPALLAIAVSASDEGSAAIPRLRYRRPTRIGIRPRPLSSDARAFPRIAPSARERSPTFIAWPRLGEVVRRSPAATFPKEASTLQNALPTSAIGERLSGL